MTWGAGFGTGSSARERVPPQPAGPQGNGTTLGLNVETMPSRGCVNIAAFIAGAMRVRLHVRLANGQFAGGALLTR